MFAPKKIGMRERPSGTPRGGLASLDPLRDHGGGSSVQKTCSYCAFECRSAWLHAIQARPGGGVDRIVRT